MCICWALDEHVTALLTGPDSTVHPKLLPLRHALVDVDHPKSALDWLQRGVGARVLAAMAAGELDISHQAIDQHAQAHAVGFVHYLLVTCGILPARDSQPEQLGPWLDQVLAEVPDEHARVLRVCATWSVFRRCAPEPPLGSWPQPPSGEPAAPSGEPWTSWPGCLDRAG